MKATLTERWTALTERLDGVGDWIAPLGLRLLLAWAFWEAGLEKFRGVNWFASIQSVQPFGLLICSLIAEPSGASTKPSPSTST